MSYAPPYSPPAPYTGTWSLNSSTAPAYYSFTTSTIPVPTRQAFTCPSCYFGATAATLHSYSATIVKTVTETVVPYVSTCDDGDITSWTSTTWSPAQPGTKDVTFTNTRDMNWTIPGSYMYYPTTYVQFLGFRRDSFVPDATTSGSEPTACAGTVIPSAINLPTSASTDSAFDWSVMAALTAAPSTTHVSGTLYFSAPIPWTKVKAIESIASRRHLYGLENIAKCDSLNAFYENVALSESTSGTTYSPYLTTLNHITSSSTISATSTPTASSITKAPSTSATPFSAPYIPTTTLSTREKQCYNAYLACGDRSDTNAPYCRSRYIGCLGYNPWAITNATRSLTCDTYTTTDGFGSYSRFISTWCTTYENGYVETNTPVIWSFVPPVTTAVTECAPLVVKREVETGKGDVRIPGETAVTSATFVERVVVATRTLN